jgi:hypothetical protein
MSSPFETHPTWQSKNPRLAERDRKRRRASIEALPKAEMPFRASDVVAYLEETGRQELVPGRDPNVGRLAYEEALIQDLGEAQLNEDEEAVHRLRKLILAGSLTVNKNTDPEAPVRAAKEMIGKLEDEQHELRRHSPDAAEDMEEHIDRIRHLASAIEHDIRGDELEDVMQTAEAAYQRTLVRALRLPHRRARKNVHRDDLPLARIVRDAIYMQHLYPYMRAGRPKRRVA